MFPHLSCKRAPAAGSSFDVSSSSPVVLERSPTHAAGCRDGRQECRERGYYHLHRQLSNTFLVHTRLMFYDYLTLNTIRYKLRLTGEACYWTEIKRRMSTQKAITTEAVNALGEKVKLRLCSNPTKAAEDIYERLQYKKMPFRRKTKVCSTQ